MPFPKPDPSSRAFLEEILPPDPAVELKPMFGNTAGFVNGHMFAGTFGSDIIVRLPEDERTRLLAEPGAEIFAPMAAKKKAAPKATREAAPKAAPKASKTPSNGKKPASKARAPRE